MILTKGELGSMSEGSKECKTCEEYILKKYLELKPIEDLFNYLYPEGWSLTATSGALDTFLETENCEDWEGNLHEVFDQKQLCDHGGGKPFIKDDYLFSSLINKDPLFWFDGSEMTIKNIKELIKDLEVLLEEKEKTLKEKNNVI